MPENKPPEKNISQFSRDSAQFGGYIYTSTGKVSSKIANDHITQVTLSLVNLHGKTVFDIGCGDGTYTNDLFRQGRPKSIFAIDPAKAAIKIARKNNTHPQIKYRLGSIYRLPQKKKYDVAIVRGVLHHLYHPAAAIKAVSQVASIVIIIEPNGYNPVLKVIEKTSKYHLEHEEKSYPPTLIDMWVKSNHNLILNRKYAGLVPFFCPAHIARILKKLEPIAEKLPLFNKIICGNYYLVYQPNLVSVKAPTTWYSFLNSFSQGLSGSDACFLNVASQLSALPIRHTIVTSALGKTLCQTKLIKANFIVTSNEKKFTNVYWAYWQRIIQTMFLPLPKNNCILYSTSDILPDVLPAFFSKLTSAKRFWVQKIFHIIPVSRKVPHLMQLLSFKLIKNSADLIIVDNAKLKRQLVNAHQFPVKKIIVIPPGVDVSLIKSIKKSKQKLDALFVGQFRQSKGIFDLIKIWPLVLVNYPKASLTIIGQDVFKNQEKLQKLVNKNHLRSRIKLLGFVSEKKKYALMKSCRLLVLPSYEEGFGMVVLEAMVCGKTTIAYDLPVFKEHFSRQVVTVPLGDTTAFANKVAEFISRPSPPASTFKTIYAKFDILKLVNKEINLINSIYEKKPSR